VGNVDGGDAGVSTEKRVKAEVDVVRAELGAEVLKFRLASEELERRARAAAAAATATAATAASTKDGQGQGVWDEAQERVFSAALGDQLAVAIAAQAEAVRKAEALASVRFESEFGMAVGEALGLRTRYMETVHRAENAEVMLAELRAALVKAQERAATYETKAECATRDAESACRALTGEKTDLESCVARLQSELAEKTHRFSALEQGTLASQSELSAQLAEQEDSHRENFNSLMKDNMVLLKRTRELESKTVDARDRVDELEAAADEGAAALVAREEQHAARGVRDAACLDAAVARAEAAEVRVAHMEEEASGLMTSIAASSEEAEALREDVCALTAQLAVSEEACEEACARRDAVETAVAALTEALESTREEGENHWQQCQVLEASREELTAALTAQKGTHASAAAFLGEEAAALRDQLTAKTAEGGDARSALVTVTEALSTERARGRALGEELKALTQTHATMTGECRRLTAEVSDGKKEAQLLRATVVELRAAVKAEAAARVDARSALDESTEELCAVSRERDTAQGALAAVAAERAALSTAVGTATEARSASDARVAQLVAALECGRKEMADSQVVCAAHKARLQEAETEAEEVRMAHSDEVRMAHAEATAALQDECATHACAVAAAAADHSALHDASTALTSQLEGTTHQRDEALAQAAAAEIRVAHMTAAVEASKADAIKKHGALAAEADALREQLDIAQSELESARMATESAQDDCESMANRVDALKTDLTTSRNAVAQSQAAAAAAAADTTAMAGLESELTAARAAATKLQATVKTTKAEAFGTELTLKNQLREALSAEERGKAREGATRAQLAKLRGELAAALEGAAASARGSAQLISAKADLAQAQALYAAAKASGEEADARSLVLEESLVDVTERLESSMAAEAAAVAAGAAAGAMTSERDDAKKEKRQLEGEIVTTRGLLGAAVAQNRSLEASAAEATAENARLCGHQNTKQKIQQHMQLKKDIQDQASRLVTQQTQLERVTQQRNDARAQLAAAASASASAEGSSSGDGWDDDGSEDLSRGSRKGTTRDAGAGRAGRVLKASNTAAGGRPKRSVDM